MCVTADMPITAVTTNRLKVWLGFWVCRLQTKRFWIWFLYSLEFGRQQPIRELDSFVRRTPVWSGVGEGVPPHLWLEDSLLTQFTVQLACYQVSHVQVAWTEPVVRHWLIGSRTLPHDRHSKTLQIRILFINQHLFRQIPLFRCSEAASPPTATGFHLLSSSL